MILFGAQRLALNIQSLINHDILNISWADVDCVVKCFPDLDSDSMCTEGILVKEEMEPKACVKQEEVDSQISFSFQWTFTFF